MLSSFRRFALVTLLALPSGACELVDAVEDGLDGPAPTPGPTAPAGDGGTTDIGGGPDTPAPTSPTPTNPTPSTPTPSNPTPSAPLAPLDVTLDVRLRVVVVSGQMLIEADCDWQTTGGGDVVVDIQVKSDLMPTWTDMLTDQPATDVGSFLVSGGRQDYHFRAVAQDLVHPERVATSRIVSIRQ